MKKLANSDLTNPFALLNDVYRVPNFLGSIFAMLFCSLLLTGCYSLIENDNGRGYRYAHGGNYFGTNPSFSPDGNKIVFGSIRYGIGDICTINNDGKDYKRLTETKAYEGEPKFSHDGSQIVFVSEREHSSWGKIFTMNIDASNQKLVTSGNFYDYSPIFSNDSSMIIFIRDKGNNYTDIYSINVDGSNLRRLTSDETPKSFLSLTANGNKLRYNAFNLKTQEVEIHEMNYDGSGGKLVLKLLKSDGEAVFSPNEKQVVFISTGMTDYKKDFYTHAEIFIMNSDGSNRKQITNTKTYKETPSFSPDGEKIMFLSLEKDGRGRGQVMTMNIDGNNLQVITNNY